MTVVITAAKRAMTRVDNAAGRETVPGERRLVMNREVTRATKASAHAGSREIARRKTMVRKPTVYDIPMGWSTRTALRVREMVSEKPLTWRAFATLESN